MGEDTSIGALRDMQDPTVFGDPDRMGSPNYYTGSDDSGGVHTNSGVGNKTAYLITDGDTFNGYTVTGLGITKAAKIYYEVQTNILISTSNYHSLYDALGQACTTLVGTAGITSSDCHRCNRIGSFASASASARK
jgi:Zn-dependent metalloprotease